MVKYADLAELASEAWRLFDHAALLGNRRVTPAIPVLFFGDLAAYDRSPLRLLTVGLNPSKSEFPADGRYSRFPRVAADQPDQYVNALSSYFGTKPYRRWFGHFTGMLHGAGASYYGDKASTSLHTDFCSPVATDPTWSRLSQNDRDCLAKEGIPLWKNLVEKLTPHIVVLSVARHYREYIGFHRAGDWVSIYGFEAAGNRRWEATSCWHDVAGSPTLFVHCPPGRTPLPISLERKHALGVKLNEVWSTGAGKIPEAV